MTLGVFRHAESANSVRFNVIFIFNVISVSGKLEGEFYIIPDRNLIFHSDVGASSVCCR